MKVNSIHSPIESLSFHAKPMQKTVIITSKNGKDVIKDEFIGYHCRRMSFMEFVTDILESLENKLMSSKK